MDPLAGAVSHTHAHDMSFVGMILSADVVVQGVMVLLVVLSLACWTIIFDRFLGLRAAARQASAFRDFSQGRAPHAPSGVGAEVLAAGEAAGRDVDDIETRLERRERVERAMRLSLADNLRGAQRGLNLLATTASAAPFIGLFGTVWGIMNSFAAIARSQDTSLAIVAPGIAEALFVTAMGLAAAIPAVVAYNRFVADVGRVRQLYSAGIAALGDRLSARARALEASE